MGVAALFLAAANLFAAPAVRTLTGGPSQFYPYTANGYVNGDTFSEAKFNVPSGIALDPSGTVLFVADFKNNAIRVITHLGEDGASQTFTFAGLSHGVNLPIAVAVDAATNVYVLNQGNGSLLRFDGRYYAAYDDGTSLATGLVNPTALALDGLTNVYVTEAGGTVIRVTPAGAMSTIGVVPADGVALRGISVLEHGQLALSDAGNSGIWLMNPNDGATTPLSGFNGAGDDETVNGMTVPGLFARFNHPRMIANAGGNQLVVADYGNGKVKVVNALNGDVSRLYGVNPSFWVPGTASSGIYPGWYDGDVCPVDTLGCPEGRQPVGLAVGPSGDVYSTETFYHIIRQVTSTDLPGPSGFGVLPYFAGTAGIALDVAGARLYIADPTDNSVDVLDLGDDSTTNFLSAANGLNHPVDVGVDAQDNVYVLNQGSGADGSLLEFDRFGNPLATNATGLSLPTAMNVDSNGKILVAEEQGAVWELKDGSSDLVVTITHAGVVLQGIAEFSDGTIVVSDAGNDVIWQINPTTGSVGLLTGTVGVPGATLGAANFAKLDRPQRLAVASGDMLLAADSGNNRLAIVNRDGAITNVLTSTNSLVWFGRPGDPIAPGDTRFVPMSSPIGVVLGADGTVYTSENQYDLIRATTGSGLTPPGSGSTSGSGQQLEAPVITPNCGYYPMGQLVRVTSPNPDVYYTLDGSDPTTNSAMVTITNGAGVIRWFNSTNDLTALRVKAFSGANTSPTVSGQPVAANTVGVAPGPTLDGSIPAGVGSTIVVPVVVNLRTNTPIRSYQFRVEVAPGAANSPPITGTFRTLTVTANDFVPLRTSEVTNGPILLSLQDQPYSIGGIRGLAISTANSGNTNYVFSDFAVVALLEIAIPTNSVPGDSYSLTVLYPSATSDGLATPVPLTAMPPATITVTNISYLVGDTAAGHGWYNAGGFGDGDLDNADVNNAFYAAVGRYVPYPFSDVFNAMDTFPTDGSGMAGGDGQIRFLDWQVILQRSLRLDPTNWTRAWSEGGVLDSESTNLPGDSGPSGSGTQKSLSAWPGLHQAVVGGLSVGEVTAGSDIQVPIYVKLANGVSLSGLQFRAVVAPLRGAPTLPRPPTFIPAPTLPAPLLQQSFSVWDHACGWALGAFSFSSRSSNFLGWITFTIPAGAQTGQGYVLSFSNADGAPDIQTQYDLETRSAYVAVNAPAALPSTCSDEWKVQYFGSLDSPNAADQADPDGDGVPNWMEYLAGTDPTDPQSNLRLTGAGVQLVEGRPQMVLQWLTAPGRVYEVQWSSDLAGGVWTSLGQVSGDGALASVPDATLTGTARYYRVQLIP